MKALILITSLLTSCFANAHGDHNQDEPMIHLTFAEDTVHAHAMWKSGPSTSNESLLKIEWKNGSSHSPTEPPGTFEISLWMPSMRHGSAPTQIQRVLDTQGLPLIGVYEISNMYFTMGGDWDVNVTLIYPDQSKETKIIKINLPTNDDGGGHHGKH